MGDSLRHVPSMAGSMSANRSSSSPKKQNSVISLTKSHIGVVEGQVERAIQSGAKSIVNGIAFPTEIAKKLQKRTTLSNKDTFIVSCFVDMFLRPPPTSVAGQKSSSATWNSPALGSLNASAPLVALIPSSATKASAFTKKSKTTTFLEDPSAADIGESLFGDTSPAPVAACRPSSGGATRHGGNLNLKEILDHEPRGPYLVRVPTNATVAEAAVIIQNTLREIQQRERRELVDTSEEHGKQLLYSQTIVPSKSIVELREAALRRALEQQSKSHPHRSEGDGKSPAAHSFFPSARRASLLPGAKRRYTSSPEVASLSLTTPASAALGGRDTPANAITQAILSSKTLSADDVLGSNAVSLHCLGNLNVDIPPCGATIQNSELQQEDAPAADRVATSSFTCFEAFSLESGDKQPSRPRLVAPMCNMDCTAAFDYRRLTIRPCDAHGRVFPARSAHREGSAGNGSSKSGVPPPTSSPDQLEFVDFDPPSNTLLSCFPRDSINFYVCLAPDANFHREQIHTLHHQMMLEKQREWDECAKTREISLHEKEAVHNEHERLRLVNSLERDLALRTQLNRPTATESFKIFVKEEAREEHEKKRERDLQEETRARAQLKERAQATLKAFYVSILRLERTVPLVLDELRASEANEWDALVEAATLDRRRIEKTWRVAQSFHKVGARMDLVALRACDYPQQQGITLL